MKFTIKDTRSSGYVSVAIKGIEVNVEWLNSEADFQLNGFAARFDFSLRLGELISFVDELKVFQSTLKGKAHFSSIEDNVCLVLSTKGLGHVSVDGTLRDTSYNIQTTFLFETDQTYLNDIIAECNQILIDLGMHID